MLEIQKFLKEKGETKGLLELEENYAIKVVKKDNRILLKYNQIESPLGNKMVQECRGVILDKRDWSVVSFPFHKFFNYGEGHAATIDYDSAVVLDKFDGSCVTLYFYENEWHVQTLGMIDAEGPAHDLFEGSFADLFWKTYGEVDLDENNFYTFELVTKYNRIVTKYDYEAVHLLAQRDKHSLVEFKWWEHEDLAQEYWSKRGVLLPKVFKANNLEDIVAMAKELPELTEGYVIVDKYCNRIKIKNPSYLAIAHFKESVTSSLRGIVVLALKNEGDEFLSYFPEFKEDYDRIHAKISEVVAQTKEVWDKIKDIGNQKEFAIEAMKCPFNGVLFSMRNKKISSIAEGISNLRPDFIIKKLGLKIVRSKSDE